ncbi:hypothetical protein [Seonamhaeicola marinus]|uniref:Uncharacterized protein n=1 Tax=Seonamhaeicola marinus TaxID=1912246 RepID=A0A5D0HVU0_9FLAO|nr:hypothetical protein [Seonamhaeicola marinus]TYA74950.1 hypothetical protein FUA24_16760 [Seonamhaeicola marinus]
MVTKEKANKNGVAKRTATANSKALKEKVEAKETVPVKKEVATTVQQPAPPVEKPKSLEERLSNFERMKGLASQRTRLADTLNELNIFKYQNSDSCIFQLKDENGKEFKTTNNNLIKLVTDVLKEQLTTRKNEIEKQILEFDM